MSTEVWLTFTLVAGAVLVLPGPTNLLVMVYALEQGLKPALTALVGVVLGYATTMVLSFAGLGALLEAWGALFALTKWAGVALLIYLGIQQWEARLEADLATGPPSDYSTRKMLMQTYIVSLLNPKGVVFFIAVFPQFLVPDETLLSQTAILGVTFILLLIPVTSAYALLAATLHERLQSTRWRRAMNRTRGAVLIGAGLMSAVLLQRST